MKTILVILTSKKAKNDFYDLEIGMTDNKNAVKPPFSPFWGYGRHDIDIQEKSQSLGSLWSLFLGVIAIFW